MARASSSSLGSTLPKLGGDSYFDFRRALSPQDLEATYRIRFQVYCLERGFLDQRHYPDGVERDEYDEHSVHVLASHRNGAPAGSARLVLDSELGFPLLGHCDLSPKFANLKDPGDSRSTQYAEISRLAVSKVFRRRQGDSVYGGPPRPHPSDIDGAEVIPFPTPQETPEIVSGIYRQLYQESKRLGVLHWVMAMERGLVVVLRRMGLVFSPIGPEVDYFGPVRPYVASVAGIEDHLFRHAPSVLRYMAQGLEPDLYPPCLERPGEAIAQSA